MSRGRNAVRRMRRDLHKDRAIPAYYIPVPGALPFLCTVRVHDEFEAIGKADGGVQGLAQAQNVTPRVVFLRDNAPILIRRNAIISVEAGEAYRVDNTMPTHDITITAQVTRLTAAEAVGLPVPPTGAGA